MTTDVYGMFVGAFFIVLSFMVLFATGSVLSVLVLWATIALVLTVLVYYGFLSIDQLLGTAAKEEKEVEKEATKPTGPPSSSGGPLLGSEVFHVSDQVCTYDEAAAVCAAYGTELATLGGLRPVWHDLPHSARLGIVYRVKLITERGLDADVPV